MKSVIQEGSSLAKAIELGWLKAGKPREFTIKIFQEAKKNFFGFTKIPAKVGIFFKEITSQDNKEKSQKVHQHANQPQQQQQSKPKQHQDQYRQPQHRNNRPNPRHQQKTKYYNKEKRYTQPTNVNDSQKQKVVLNKPEIESQNDKENKD